MNGRLKKALSRPMFHMTMRRLGKSSAEEIVFLNRGAIPPELYLTIQSRIEERESKRKALDEEIKKLKEEKAKRNKKHEVKAIDILGRSALAKIDSNNVKNYLDGLNASDKKSLIDCLSKLKPELKDFLEKPRQSKKS